MLGLVPSGAAVLAFALPFVQAQLPPTPASFPHDYPGKPSGDFSPEWQSYFEVTDPLPDITFPFPHSYAGSIGVNRPDHPNNTLFFWAIEKENGSLAVAAGERNDVPVGIWLNGGPGSSSMLGFVYENGPARLQPDGSFTSNEYSWDKLADYIWVDQPVGTGYSTADSDGYVHDEDEMGFLENLVKVFPSLKTRPIYLTGESYSGTYIPYIMKTYFGLADPPVNIVKFAIGDGTVGSEVVFQHLPTVTTIETYPQLIGYDPEVFEWFREQEHLCGYDLNFTYPQNGHFPDLQPIPPSDPNRAGFSDFTTRKALSTQRFQRLALKSVRTSRHSVRGVEARSQLAHLAATNPSGVAGLRRREEHSTIQKRDLSLRTNGTIDSWYGCFLLDEMIEYALNYSLPWNISGDASTWQGFDVYQIPDATDPEVPIDGSSFFNDARTRAALHAPTSKDWSPSIIYPFLGDPVNGIDPSVEPMAFLTELATNASARGVPVVLYSGNDDALVAHRGTEVVIQNTTFGGTQGFSRKPSTPWFDDDGQLGGIVHQERNWTYVLVQGAGHLIPAHQPQKGFVLLREFILGNNRTGLVTKTAGGALAVLGGEDAALAVDAILGQAGIFVGSVAPSATFMYPAGTVAAWEKFIATATATILPPSKSAVIVGAAAVNDAGSLLGASVTAVLAGFSLVSLLVFA
ncbi:alpha/beta-hydrolase [Trametes maxima]|nr:alpha/beta-hydrolase [Trametes maxima]